MEKNCRILNIIKWLGQKHLEWEHTWEWSVYMVSWLVQFIFKSLQTTSEKLNIEHSSKEETKLKDHHDQLFLKIEAMYTHIYKSLIPSKHRDPFLGKICMPIYKKGNLLGWYVSSNVDFHTYTSQFYFTEYMPPTKSLYLDWTLYLVPWVWTTKRVQPLSCFYDDVACTQHHHNSSHKACQSWIVTR